MNCVCAIFFEDHSLIADSVQRPAELHGVFTAAPSICHGGYFLAASTLKRTLVGSIHYLMEGRVVTNSECRTVGQRVSAIIALNYRYYVLDDRRENGMIFTTRNKF